MIETKPNEPTSADASAADPADANRSPPSDWQPASSADAVVRLADVMAGQSPALQMDFEFKQGGGYVVARRAWSRSLPSEFAVRCRLRGRGIVRQLELKLVDPSGQNVWRHVIQNPSLGARWKRPVSYTHLTLPTTPYV